MVLVLCLASALTSGMHGVTSGLVFGDLSGVMCAESAATGTGDVGTAGGAVLGGAAAGGAAAGGAEVGGAGGALVGGGGAWGFFISSSIDMIVRPANQ